MISKNSNRKKREKRQESGITDFRRHFHKTAALFLIPVLGLAAPAYSVSALADEVSTNVAGDNVIPNADDMNILPGSEEPNTPDPDITDAEGNPLDSSSGNSGRGDAGNADGMSDESGEAGYADVTADESGDADSAELDSDEEPASVEVYDVNNKTAKIHFLTLDGSTEAILLECNGHFAMVDSGEDTTYPDGSDSRYPDRPGITKNAGFESQVISYLRSVGVTEDNFDFYIGTHAHSDHIGSAPQVIEAFRPDRVYIPEYKDSYINSNPNLWDNLYCYDRMLTAAQDVGASIILGFDPDQPIYPDRVDINGTLTWHDNNNAANTRPSSLNVSVTSSLTGKTTTVQATPRAGDKWTFSLPNMQKYDDNKKAISYTVTVSAPNGYTVSKSGSYQFTLTSSAQSNAISGAANADYSTGPGEASVSVTESAQTSQPQETEVGTDETLSSENYASSESGVSGDVSGSDTHHSGDVEVSGNSSENVDAADVTDISEVSETTGTGLTSSSAQTEDNRTDTKSAEGQDGLADIESAEDGEDLTDVESAEEDKGLSDIEPAETETFLSGVIDAQDSGGEEAATDDMETTDIPEEDLVDPTNEADPANAAQYTAGVAGPRIGKFDKISEEQNTVASPNFTLGGDMKIEIKHYGSDYKKTTTNDANNFCIGVLVTANGKKAFLSGDINNYQGAETALASSVGKVNIMTLGHHGYYGSNTSTYINTLAPTYMILCGQAIGLDASAMSDDSNSRSLLSILEERSNARSRFYPTGWYSEKTNALVFTLNKSRISTNVPYGLRGMAAYTCPSSNQIRAMYYNGLLANYKGWFTNKYGYKAYFNNSKYNIKNAWLAENGKWYYLNSTGGLVTGWQHLSWSGGHSWFYFDSNGAMRTGWQYLSWSGGKNWFYFDSNGAMRTGWQYLPWSGGKNWFYFNPGSGAMLTGWQQLSWSGGRNWFYFTPGNGAMHTGWQYLPWSGGKNWFYFTGNGAMLTGWQQLSWSGGKNWFYFNPGSGSMATGWLKLGNTWYYLKPSNGVMLTGTHTINGKRYRFSSSGALL